MQRIKRAGLLFGTFLLCANFGSDDTSVEGREKPKINFYGKLTDTSGNSFKVENITISGMYKQIPVYQKPDDKNTDPSINITRIDFTEIDTIRVPHPKTVLTFNNRAYIELEISSKDPKKTKQTYIIERSKRVICDQINSAGPIEKDLAFQAVDTLSITGHKSTPPAEVTKVPVENKKTDVKPVSQKQEKRTAAPAA